VSLAPLGEFSQKNMATNSLEICNNALTLIGSRRITALSDPSREGRTCNDNYDVARKAVLRLHPWNFATDRVELAAKVITGTSDVGGEVNVLCVGHGFTTGDLVTVADVQGTNEANVTDTVTRIDNDNFTIDDTVYANTYVSGGVAAKAPLNQFRFKFALPSDFIRIHTVADNTSVQLAADEYLIEGLFLLTDYSTVRLRYVKNVTTTTQFDALFDEALAAYLAEKICYKITGSEALTGNLKQTLKDIMTRARYVDSVEEPSRQLDGDEWIRARWSTNQGYVRDPMT
jgi:hypothetical protein